MKKILLSTFGATLLTSSVGLSTGQNVSASIKQTENQQLQTQKFVNEGYSLNNNFNGDLSDKQIQNLNLTAQQWDNESNSKFCFRIQRPKIKH